MRVRRSQLRACLVRFSHETHSFSPVSTALDDFRPVYGGKVLERARETRTGVAGFADSAREQGVELVPVLSAGAGPAGPVTTDAYETIRAEVLSGIRDAMPVNGVLLALHGAMLTEDLQDPEGDLIYCIRRLVGPDTVVAATFDLHGNISPQMVQDIDLLFAYRTYPHVDGYDQAVNCVRGFVAAAEGQVHPVRHIEKCPWMPHSQNMLTAGGPMAEIEERSLAWEDRDDIINVSPFGGFPWSDTRHVGFSVIVTADGDPDLARRAARDVAAFAWERRHRFTVDWVPVEDALDRALGANHQPVVLVDASDNPGSGGTGDTTGLLRALVDGGVTDTVVSLIRDEESVARAVNIGVGSTGRFALGGRLTPDLGPPVEVTATVQTISDGTYWLKGPMSRGARACVGRAAVLDAGGLQILIAERASSTNDPELLRRHGIQPEEPKILALKVKNHFRAAFEPLVSEIINVDTPGLAGATFDALPYQNIPRPIYPLDLEVQYPG